MFEEDASQHLGVSKKTLEYWREVGYLKPGTHWRSAPSKDSMPWKPKVIYHLSWCKEIIEYWREKDVPMTDLVA
ncbi:hypothetical protein EV08_0470 [Prochlorococcus marinus str. SS2]|uniref:Uncharacterized protein n=1 Tax=Prochlorococcus marinus (strain SARG / CCMP1375 / SS120) TaxID=167539 RepID=Q7VCF8_PROMA|nr:Predicted protein [Prochlorococcus marinus subsp. marinus str. CCMP1375]KGG21865.1 hypothetical protein EV08_0470 [Prochlorococcus marinus str. SS2]KGG23704.1 hypothetical protein EV09_1329 [Prochlorococcus marinus str. SS35]